MAAAAHALPIPVVLGSVLAAATLSCASPAGAGGPSFTAHPLPRCQSALITRSGYLYKAAGEGGEVIGALDLGYQRNIDTKSGWGVMALAEFSSNETKIGIRGRYRRWLGDGDASLDLEPGVAFVTIEEPSQTPAFLARVSLNANEWFGITTQVAVGPQREIVYDQASPLGRTENLGTSTALRVGFHFGTYPGAILPVASLGLYVASMAVSGSD